MRISPLVLPALATLTITLSACSDRGIPTGDPRSPRTAAVTSLAVSPEMPDATVGMQFPLTAIIEDASGNEVRGQLVSWSSSNPSIADISPDGLLTAYEVGEATITAHADDRVVNMAVNVSPTPADTIVVSPQSPVIAAGSSLRLSASARERSGAQLYHRVIVWSSLSPSVASVSADGLVEGLSPGTATVRATTGAKSTTVSVSVTGDPTPYLSDFLTVLPAAVNLLHGQTAQLAISMRDASRQPLPVRGVTWSSSNERVARVSTSGLVTANELGTATVVASMDGKTASATVVVSPTLVLPPQPVIPEPPAPEAPPRSTVSSIVVSSPGMSIAAGHGMQLTAVVRDAAGAAVNDCPVVWTRSDASVAGISSTGRFVAITAGDVTITASCGGKSGSVTIRVVGESTQLPSVVATMTVSPAQPTLSVGQSLQLAANLKDASGNTIGGRAFTFTSGNPSAVSVNARGVITGVSPGSAGITVASDDVQSTITVSVAGEPERPTPPPSPAPPVSPPPPVTSSPQGILQGTPNMPAGMTVVKSRPFSSKSATPDDVAGSEGWYPSEDMYKWSIVPDPSAPQSPSGVAQFGFSKGTYSDDVSYTPGWAATSLPGAPTEMYVSIWVKVSNNFQGHITGANKQTEWALGVQNVVIPAVFGQGSGRLQPRVHLSTPDRRRYDNQSYLLPNMMPNVSFTRGVWHRFEIYARLNTPGVQNGIMRWWLDGQLVGDYTDWLYREAGVNTTWTEFKMDQVWGGSGGTIPETFFTWVDHIVVAVR